MARKTVFRRLSKWLPLSGERWSQTLDEDDGDYPQIHGGQEGPVIDIEPSAAEEPDGENALKDVRVRQPRQHRVEPAQETPPTPAQAPPLAEDPLGGALDFDEPSAEELDLREEESKDPLPPKPTESGASPGLKPFSRRATNEEMEATLRRIAALGLPREYVFGWCSQHGRDYFVSTLDDLKEIEEIMQREAAASTRRRAR